MSSKNEIENRKESIKNWFKKKENLILVGIILLSIIIRLYYFFVTKSQPLWWDESDYLAYAKNLAGFNVNWIVTAKHNSIFPFLIAIFFKIGFSEAFTKMIFVVIPSILVVLLTYFVIKSMYRDGRIALISSFLMAVLWSILFNSNRFHVGILGLFFGLLAIYVFWEGYEKKQKIFGKNHSKWAISLAVIFSILAYSTRRGYFLFGGFFLIYILLTKNWKDLIKDKYNWIGGGIAIILFLLVENFIFASQIGGVAGGYFHPENPLNLSALDIFPAYFNGLGGGFTNILYYLFIFGFLVVLCKIILSYGHIKKEFSKEVRADIFHLLSIVLTLAFFTFVLRTGTFGEPRWYFPILMGSLIFMSKGTITLADFFKKHHKKLPLIVILVLIGAGGYYQIQHADLIIKSKVESYMGIKEAGLFLNKISGENDLVIVQPQPQMAYYSERKVIRPPAFIGVGKYDEVPFEEFLNKLKKTPSAKYVLVSFSEPNHPEWMRKDIYLSQDGRSVLAGWEIPFMNTSINFQTGEQDIKGMATYGDITFSLLDIKREIFIYEVIRN